MNDAEFNELLEKSWREPLTSEEETRVQSWLAAHPECHTAWDESAQLNLLLETLPDAPISSNFTSQLLAAVDREELAVRAGLMIPKAFSWSAWLARWFPRTALAALVCALGFVSFRVYEERREADIYKGVRLVRTMAALPHPEALQDFEAIQSLSAVPPMVDLELLAALE